MPRRTIHIDVTDTAVTATIVIGGHERVVATGTPTDVAHLVGTQLPALCAPSELAVTA